MISVLVCSITTSGLILGLLAGIATGFFSARVAIVAALRDDATAPRVRRTAAMPARGMLA